MFSAVQMSNLTCTAALECLVLMRHPRARGFVRIAFRINNDASRFEALCLRPDNERASDHVRRNHI